MKKNLITWAFLVALTVLSYFFGEKKIAGYSMLMLIIFVFAKSCFIGFQFMELKKAHVIWKIGFLSIVALFTIIITLIAF